MPQQPTNSEPPARDAAIRELFRISGVPATERQLTGLRARREELRAQLAGATDRRAELQERLTQETDGDVQRLIRQQVEHATGAMLSTEDAITTTDRQIAAAPPELLAATQSVPPPERRDVVPEDEAAGVAFSTFGAGVVLTLLISRWRRRRRRGAGRGSSMMDAPLPDGQLQHLQQLGMAVEAIAVEVERIGEGQRFVTQLLSDTRGGQSLPRSATPARVATPH